MDPRDRGTRRRNRILLGLVWLAALGFFALVLVWKIRSGTPVMP